MSPPNCTPESAYVRQVKHLIEAHLTSAERARLRPWLLAHYDVAGLGRARVDDAAGDLQSTAT